MKSISARFATLRNTSPAKTDEATGRGGSIRTAVADGLSRLARVGRSDTGKLAAERQRASIPADVAAKLARALQAPRAAIDDPHNDAKLSPLKETGAGQDDGEA